MSSMPLKSETLNLKGKKINKKRKQERKTFVYWTTFLIHVIFMIGLLYNLNIFAGGGQSPVSSNRF